jgi:hypothetical protein
MRTLKVRIGASAIVILTYECLLEAPDDADPDELIELVREQVDAEKFFVEGYDKWFWDWDTWEVATEGTQADLPRLRYCKEVGKAAEVAVVPPG